MTVKGTGETDKLTICLTTNQLKQLDQMRQDLPRSAYIRRAVLSLLKSKQSLRAKAS
ncbi:MAG: hypothetical protein WBF33_33345 [Candidatus Nitrosopolaris sp.]